MKQTLLIIALFIGIGNVNAQDATNDATWEETVNWILEKSKCIEDPGLGAYTFVKIENNILYTKVNTSSWDINYEIDLSKLHLIDIWRVGDDSGIGLKTTGKNVKRDHNEMVDSKNNKYGIVYVNYFMLSVQDLEMRERVFKAFQHLAYLAVENREAERKSSGDKF